MMKAWVFFHTYSLKFLISSKFDEEEEEENNGDDDSERDY